MASLAFVVTRHACYRNLKSEVSVCAINSKSCTIQVIVANSLDIVAYTSFLTEEQSRVTSEI